MMIWAFGVMVFLLASAALFLHPIARRLDAARGHDRCAWCEHALNPAPGGRHLGYAAWCAYCGRLQPWADEDRRVA